MENSGILNLCDPSIHLFYLFLLLVNLLWHCSICKTGPTGPKGDKSRFSKWSLPVWPNTPMDPLVSQMSVRQCPVTSAQVTSLIQGCMFNWTCGNQSQSLLSLLLRAGEPVLNKPLAGENEKNVVMPGDRGAAWEMHENVWHMKNCARITVHPVQQVYDQREALTELETGLPPAVVPVSRSDVYCQLYFERYTSEPFSPYSLDSVDTQSHTTLSAILCCWRPRRSYTCTLCTTVHLQSIDGQKYCMFKGGFTILHSWKCVCERVKPGHSDDSGSTIPRLLENIKPCYSFNFCQHGNKEPHTIVFWPLGVIWIKQLCTNYRHALRVKKNKNVHLSWLWLCNG